MVPNEIHPSQRVHYPLWHYTNTYDSSAHRCLPNGNCHKKCPHTRMSLTYYRNCSLERRFVHRVPYQLAFPSLQLSIAGVAGQDLGEVTEQIA